MSEVCIYHGGCTDGVAAAYAVWLAYPGFTFYPGIYQQDPPDVSGKDVVLVDFSYKRDALERMATEANTILILDHHKTARDDLAGFPPPLDGPYNPLAMADWQRQCNAPAAVHAKFDMDRCGALLAWDYFHSNARPQLLIEIDKQDRWLPDRDPELIMALRSYPHRPDDDSREAWERLMAKWDWLMSDSALSVLKGEGRAIYRYYRQRVDETKLHSAPMIIGDYRNVPVVNAPYYLASDVAGELAQDAPDGIAACWWRNKDGSCTFSLRSRGDVDVGVLATTFGGGGHPGAAGFRVPSLNSILAMDELAE